MRSAHSTGTGMTKMTLTPEQAEVVAKLVQRVRALTHRGLTMRQIEDTLIIGEGWPLAAVRSAVEQVKRANPSRDMSSER